MEYARNQAQKRKKKLVIVTLRNKKIDMWDDEINYSCCSPTEFVGLINHADLVVTNSFHGTAMSIIMRRNFVVVRNSEAKIGMDNSRLDNILHAVNLDERFSDIVDVDESIDYSIVDNNIANLRKEGLCYLEELQGI